jgi:hypothetical protein
LRARSLLHATEVIDLLLLHLSESMIDGAGYLPGDWAKLVCLKKDTEVGLKPFLYSASLH